MKVRTESISSLNELLAKLTAPPLALTARTSTVMETHLEKIGGIALIGPGRG